MQYMCVAQYTRFVLLVQEQTPSVLTTYHRVAYVRIYTQVHDVVAALTVKA